MKYLTTLEVAHELGVSKQTVLNWLYAGRIQEPPRNAQGYRLWSPSRVDLVRAMMQDGRVHKRTIMHQTPKATAAFLTDYAREVAGVLGEAGISEIAFTRELAKALARQRRSAR
jgi:DNA-binding transcriptional MerR regulator